MPSFLLPSRPNQQPQQPSIANRGRLLSGAQGVIVGGTPLNLASGVPLVTVGSGVAQRATQAGRAESFRKNFYRKTEALAIGTASFVEVWSGIPIAYGAAGLATDAGFLTGSSNNLTGIAANGRSGVTTWGAVYNWPTFNDSLEVLPLGIVTTIIAARYQDRMELWRDGKLIKSFTQAPMNYGTTPMIIGGFLEDTAYWTSSNDTVLAARVLGEWSTADLRSISTNPWALFSAPPRRLWYGATAATSITATLAWTEADEVMSIAGLLTNRASAAWAEAGDAMTVASVITDRGAISWTEQGDSVALSGTVQMPAAPSVSAAMAWTEAGDTASIVARLLNRASIAATEQGDTWALTAYAEPQPVKPTISLTVRFNVLPHDFNPDVLHLKN